MNELLNGHMDLLIKRYPALDECKKDIRKAYIVQSRKLCKKAVKNIFFNQQFGSR